MKRMALSGRQRASPSALGSTFMTSSSGYQRPPFFVSTLGCDVPGSYHLITLCETNMTNWKDPPLFNGQNMKCFFVGCEKSEESSDISWFHGH